MIGDQAHIVCMHNVTRLVNVSYTNKWTLLKKKTKIRASGKRGEATT